MTCNITIFRDNEKFLVEVEKGANLLKSLQKQGFNLSAPCGGGGICGKCKFKLLAGEVKINSAEKDLLTEKEIKNGIRLACCHNINDDLSIELTVNDEINILTDGITIDLDFDPLITKKEIKLTEPTLTDQTDYLKRIFTENYNIKDIKFNLIPKLAKLVHKNKITAIINEDIIIDINENFVEKNIYGIAIDIGTTTIAMYLLDLDTATEIKIHSSANPQSKFGADVVSRINYTLENKDGLKKMQEELIKALNQGIKDLTKGTTVSSDDIYQLSIVGNTVMLHSLLAVSAETIAKAPYAPIFTDGLILTPKELSININKNGVIQLLPSVSSYIGADIIGDLLVTDHNKDQWSLMIDIGTNGEIVLAKGNKIYACSAAAGPAFEGAKITHGTAGVPGAVSKYIGDDYQTIAHATPVGICGSGLLDVITHLLDKNYINENGAFLDSENLSEIQKEKMIKYKGQKAYIVISEEETANGDNIVLTQKDIREFQLAKGAISAGIQVLINEAKISYQDIDKVYLAGGFGNYINPNNARKLGLIPNQITDNIIKIGNGAGLGAKIYLMDKKKKKESKNIVKKIEYIELSKSLDFQTYFMENMIFKKN